jgi:hypothetical protein
MVQWWWWWWWSVADWAGGDWRVPTHLYEARSGRRPGGHCRLLLLLLLLLVSVLLLFTW